MNELTKFQRIVDRIMTPEEAAEKCVALGLNEDTTKWIVNEFERANDDINSGDIEEPERVTGKNGRLAVGQSWEDVRDELYFQMTGDEFEEELPEVEKVYNEFFEE